MSQETVETWERVVAVYVRRDKEAFLAEMHPDAETIPDPTWPEQGPFVGEAMWDFHVEIEDAWGDATEPTVDIIDAGDRLVAAVRRVTRGRGSDIPVDITFHAVVTFSEGRIARIQWFQAREKALEAAGLSE
jgi:ketosteroid isomerase-like protein